MVEISYEGTEKFSVKAPGMFGWEPCLGRVDNSLRVTALTFVSCDYVDMEELSVVLDLGWYTPRV